MILLGIVLALRLDGAEQSDCQPERGIYLSFTFIIVFHEMDNFGVEPESKTVIPDS
jgi:hypothetical protein